MEALEDPYNYFDEESTIDTMVKGWRAEIAEIRDTALRWRPDEAVGHRKIAHA
jgi:hypothetical protein